MGLVPLHGNTSHEQAALDPTTPSLSGNLDSRPNAFCTPASVAVFVAASVLGEPRKC